jgi:hypothetical protein
MAEPYTRRLGAIYHSDSDPVKLYEAIAGETTIVRDICFTHYDTQPRLIRVNAQPGSGPAFSLAWVGDLAPLHTHHVDLRQELAVGESIYVSSDAAQWSVMVTGLRLRET